MASCRKKLVAFKRVAGQVPKTTRNSAGWTSSALGYEYQYRIGP
jgi:hypothetical protein